MTLPREAERLALHLTARPAPAGCADRYARACDLLLGSPTPRDVRVAAFAFRHRWALGPLDAAVSLLRPDSLLRRKLLLAAAILEATPEGAATFLPRATSGPRLAARLLVAGLVEAAWLAVGVPLLLALEAGESVSR